MALSLLDLQNTERFQNSVSAPFRLAGLFAVKYFGARLKSEAAANGGLIFTACLVGSTQPLPDWLLLR
jgi:hypothetical protein